jgi:hypothetical protein
VPLRVMDWLQRGPRIFVWRVNRKSSIVNSYADI